MAQGTNVIKRGHIIVFYKAYIDKNSHDLKVTMQESEVSDYAWLSMDELREIIYSEPNQSITGGSGNEIKL